MRDLKRWLPLARIPLALLGVALFFTLYNRFILNTNLQSLKMSLSVLNSVARVGQAEAALFLVDQTLAAEMAKEEPDLERVAALQYGEGTLASDRLGRPVEDAQVMVAIVTQEQEISRSPLLKTVDRIVTGLQSAPLSLSLLPRQASRGTLSEMTNTPVLQQAIRLERLGNLKEAAAIYEKLLEEYPYYSKRSILFLRLGSLHQRMQAFDQAERSFRKGRQTASHPSEVLAAEQKLQGLSQARRARGLAKRLEQRLRQTPDPSERQRIGFQWGNLRIQSSDMEGAAQAFQEAALADPQGRLSIPSRFKQAWCLERMGRMDDALERFQEILLQDPRGSWGAVSSLQVAEIYKTQGNYAAAAGSYEQMIFSTQEAAFGAIGHVQAGFTYLIDLRNPEKGKVHLQYVQDHFPASPFSGALEKPTKIRAALASGAPFPTTAPASKAPSPPAATPAETDQRLEVGSPITKWLEGFLPIFVEVFADRLARYMQVIGEKSLTRRFTEEEFREMVVRRIEQRFPGQIKHVVTKIRPEGFVGSGTVKLGILQFQVSAQMGIVLQEERPHVEIHEVRIGAIPVPAPLLKFLERQVNVSIDQKQYPLKVKRYELREGYALISVELVESQGIAGEESKLVFH